MSDVVTITIPEERVEGRPLGRHIEHDPASRAFAAVTSPLPAEALQNILHPRHGSIFNQGQIGSCTGNATAGAINTEPMFKVHRKTLLHEPDAVALYHLATVLDGFPGTYPPDDTGSSGLAACKGAKQKGWISGYKHAFGINDALTALQKVPVITGVNWYEGFDTPDANGVVAIAGQVRGGHEFEVLGYHPVSGDPLDALVEAANSWGTSWGKSGRFFFTVRTWAQLLSEQGDATVLVP